MSTDSRVYRDIVAARVKLLFDNPPAGELLARLALVDASDWCETVATDDRSLFYNRDFIAGLSRPELLALLIDFAASHAGQ